MKEKETSSLNLPREIVHRMHLYQPLLKLWKFKNKPVLSIKLISEYLDIPSHLITHDFYYFLNFSTDDSSILPIDQLIDSIDSLLREKPFREAILIGAGKLGCSLLRNENLLISGLKIIAAFDIDEQKVGKTISGIKIQHMEKLTNIVRQMHLKMALIATAPENSSRAVELIAKAGVKVIWNFTHANFPEPKEIIIQHTNSVLNIESDYQKIIARI